MSTYQQTLNFFQRRLSAIETDIQDLIVMYLQAVSQKNMALAQKCEITLRSAREHQYTATQALKAYERPIRKSV